MKPDSNKLRVYRYDRLLHWSECDPGGIIYFPNYARWMTDGVNLMMRSIGIDPNARIDRETTGGLPVLGISLKFYEPPRLHETITHEIEVVKLGGKSLELTHRFWRGETLLAEASDLRVWARHELLDERLTSVPIPDNVRERLSTSAPFPPIQ